VSTCNAKLCSLHAAITPSNVILCLQHLSHLAMTLFAAFIYKHALPHNVSLHGCCNTGEYYCSGSCYQITCATLALLKASTAPSILLSTEAKTVVNSSHALVLTYADPVAFNLLPCASSGTHKNQLVIAWAPELFHAVFISGFCTSFTHFTACQRADTIHAEYVCMSMRI